jgi:3-polyprenyl-4-hydroxybenzoate decarboxylase
MLKNITFSVEESLIRKARAKALKENKNLNLLVREWIAKYAAPEKSLEELQALMARFSYANPGRKFTRDEMNER